MEQTGDRIGQWLQYGQGTGDASGPHKGDRGRDREVDDREGASLGEAVYKCNA